MNRFAALVVFITATVLVPLPGSAQDFLADGISSSAPAPFEHAALDLSVPFSSSSSSLAQSYGGRAPASQNTQVVNQPQGSSRPLSGIAVGVKFGLAGVGFDVATPLVPGRLNLRGGASFFSYSPSTISEDNLNINGNLKLQNSAVMVDFFPFRGHFRISGGMTVYNDTNLNGTLSVPNGQSVTLGGSTYYSDPNSPLVGTGTFVFGGKTAGRVSIGTGNMLPRKGHFAFETEIGVQFFSQPTVNYAFTGEGCSSDVNGVYTGCGPIPQSSITAEQSKLQNDLTDLRYFPILSFGLSYKIH